MAVQAVYISDIGYSLGEIRQSVEQSYAQGLIFSNAKLLAKSGCQFHHLCRDDQTTYDLACASVHNLITEAKTAAGKSLQSIGGILYATCLTCNGNLRVWQGFCGQPRCKTPHGFPRQFLQAAKSCLAALFEKLNLDIQWLVVQDPLFSPRNNPKHLLQRLHPNKHEMVLENRLAVGSANNHRSYFDETYDITINKNSAHSACIAFGIERWLVAFTVSYGQHPSAWPLDVLEEI